MLQSFNQGRKEVLVIRKNDFARKESQSFSRNFEKTFLNIKSGQSDLTLEKNFVVSFSNEEPH
jgi:hypothetical protein